MILVGFALFVLLPGLANFLYVQKDTLEATPRLGTISIPVLSDIPVVGTPLFSGNIFYWLTIVASVALSPFARTQAGLVITAAGHEPEAVRASGGARPRWCRPSPSWSAELSRGSPGRRCHSGPWVPTSQTLWTAAA